MGLNQHKSFPGTSSLKLMLGILLCFSQFNSLEAQWTKSTQFDENDMAADLAEAYTFQKYPTYDQYLAMMQGFASDYPEICRLDTIGYSTGGRMLLALKISDQVVEDEAEAAFFYSSSMHGNEVVGYVLLLRLAHTLLTGYGNNAEIDLLVDNLQTWINPLANPDGAFSGNSNQSLELAVRGNANGVDLNRDFPNARLGEADDTTGRETETKNMMLFHQEHEFVLSANIHSGTEVVNYPWDDREYRHADDAWYRFVSREYADEAMAVDPGYMWGWPENGITNGWDWYQAIGTRQDYVNAYLGGRELTLELSDEFLLPAAELDNHWNINERSLINYMSQCLYGIRGKVTDLESGDPIRALVHIENHDSAYSEVYSSANHGDFYRLIKGGVYDLVVSAPGYISDTIPDVRATDYQATNLHIHLSPYPLTSKAPLAPGFRIYPNPVVHSFILQPENLPPGRLKISIYTLDGRIIYHSMQPWDGTGLEISTRQMEGGIYLLRCSMDGFQEVKRLLVIKP